MNIQQDIADAMADAVKTAGQALNDTITVAFGPGRSRELRRQADKLNGEADEIDRKVAEVRARRDATRRKHLLMSYVAAGVKPPQSLIDNPETSGDTQ